MTTYVLSALHRDVDLFLYPMFTCITILISEWNENRAYEFVISMRKSTVETCSTIYFRDVTSYLKRKL